MDWTTFSIVIGSNAIMGTVYWLITNRQIKHSDERLDKQLEAQREADKRKWEREVRDETLVKLRDELARMAGMLRLVVDLATQADDEVDKDKEKIMKELVRAVEGWEEYVYSGEFLRTVNMQYDYNIRFEAHDIMVDYQSAYNGIRESSSGGKKEKDKAIREAIDVVQRNDVRVSKVQEKIVELREGL
jgi:hypothetical protein